MECASNRNQNGFTLVEISIVMIIIGLLIGGTFGGMKLIENMQVNRTVQDLKAIDSAALSFKDTYGRLPGDMPNTAARLPNCTAAPCSTAGNGDRRIGPLGFGDVITATSESYTFWSHLQAADLLSIGTKNTVDMTFGEGQPESPIGGGLRVIFGGGALVHASCGETYDGSATLIGATMEAAHMSTMPGGIIGCQILESADRKIDDGIPYNGAFIAGYGCDPNPIACNGPYRANSSGMGIYDFKGF